jgi:ectoine hydroxylase-related dioxygenase (phytanoyl-CoA dioxygenase family)
MSLAQRIESDGFALVSDAVSQQSLRRVIDALNAVGTTNGRAGRRNVAEEIPEVRELASAAALHALARQVLLSSSFVVRVLLFDKTASANWSVGWHQDTVIAVRERAEAPGFFGWSVKAGVPHVHPPAEILDKMLTLRVHLDDCGEENGPLRVIPGSHRNGRLSDEAIADWVASPEAVCPLRAGGVLLMRPLILHASAPASAPQHRRVLHLEFAADPLPHGLEWYEQIAPAAA